MGYLKRLVWALALTLIAAHCSHAVEVRLLQTITASDDINITPTQAKNFGSPVAISNGYLMVGSPRQNRSFVYDLASGSYLHDIALPEPTEHNSNVNFAFAPNGDIALVGMLRYNDRAGFAGVFDLTTGEQLFELTPSYTARENYFGTTVDLDDRHYLVGAWDAAYLFDAATGQELMRLVADDPGDYNSATHVLLAGNEAFVSSPIENAPGYESGQTHGYGTGVIRRFDLSTGEQLQRYSVDVPLVNDRLGESMVVSGNYLFAGSPTIDRDYSSVYVFDIQTGEQLLRLTPEGESDWGNFGQSLGLIGNLLVVGSQDEFQNNHAIYLFDVRTLEQVAKISSPGDGYGFGRSLSIEGRRLATSHVFHEGITGRAFVMEIVPEPRTAYVTVGLLVAGVFARLAGVFGGISAVARRTLVAQRS